VALAASGAVAQGITASEAARFRADVSACWLFDPADADVVVTLQVELDRAGRIIGRPTLLDGSGGDEAAIARAFDRARRALLLCQGSGYDLPPSAFAAWREMELTFDPRVPLG
jgi:hypothetical protein